MAKKAVASLQTGSKKLVKAIRVVKKNENKGYCFEEKILPQDLVNDRKSRHRRIKKLRRYERLAATSQLSLW